MLTGIAFFCTILVGYLAFFNIPLTDAKYLQCMNIWICTCKEGDLFPYIKINNKKIKLESIRRHQWAAIRSRIYPQQLLRQPILARKHLFHRRHVDVSFPRYNFIINIIFCCCCIATLFGWIPKVLTATARRHLPLIKWT
jgi:hypothetical protein